MYCMCPPGESAWVVDQYSRVGGAEAGTSGTRTINLKKSLEGEAGEMYVETGDTTD
jgi:hypothetical protein